MTSEVIKDIEDIKQEVSIRNREIKKAILSGDSDVQKFYEHAVVFITGGSGFVGKQLIEKLLRSCNIRKIYILLRTKKGKTIQDRLRATLDDPVYEELHKEQSSFIDKLIPVQGDTEEENLGLNQKNWQTLTDEVNVIFHAAATINFRETMKTATLTNVRGAREMLRLAKDCKHLKSVVHVSTAYAHATSGRIKKDVKEDFYESPIKPDTLIELAELLDDDKLTAMMEPLMKGWPNIYTFTKAVAEELVRVMGGDLPLCVVRPAIVISAYREPCPGWVDVKNVYGPSGIILGISLGITHTVLASDEIKIDFVPVDIVNNALIVAAWETSNRYVSGHREKVIYTISVNRLPFTWWDVRKTLNQEARNIVTPKTLWYCFAVQTPYKLIYLLLTWLLHYIPGAIVDGCCVLFGQKPRFFKIYKLVYSVSSVFVFFTNNEWLFQDSNTQNLYNKLSTTDKLLYNCDMGTMNMNELIYIWTYGVGRFIVKDDLKHRQYAIRKQTILKIVHFTFFPLYFNCPVQEIDEKFYNISIPGEELLAEIVDEKTLTAITPGYIHLSAVEQRGGLSSRYFSLIGEEAFAKLWEINGPLFFKMNYGMDEAEIWHVCSMGSVEEP